MKGKRPMSPWVIYQSFVYHLVHLSMFSWFFFFFTFFRFVYISILALPSLRLCFYTFSCSLTIQPLLSSFLLPLLSSLLLSSTPLQADGGSALRVFVLRLGPGEELFSSLLSFVEERKLRAPFVITCVGSVTKATLRLANATAENTNEVDWQESVVYFGRSTGVPGFCNSVLFVKYKEKWDCLMPPHRKVNGIWQGIGIKYVIASTSLETAQLATVYSVTMLCQMSSASISQN